MQNAKFQCGQAHFGGQTHSLLSKLYGTCDLSSVEMSSVD